MRAECVCRRGFPTRSREWASHQIQEVEIYVQIACFLISHFLRFVLFRSADVSSIDKMDEFFRKRNQRKKFIIFSRKTPAEYPCAVRYRRRDLSSGGIQRLNAAIDWWFERCREILLRLIFRLSQASSMMMKSVSPGRSVWRKVPTNSRTWVRPDLQNAIVRTRISISADRRTRVHESKQMSR